MILVTESATTLPMLLRETILKAVEDSGQTRYRIAKDSGVEYAALTRFLKGERDITLATAQKLCTYFGLELISKRPTPKKGRKKSSG